jgi:hypothetical protein
MQLPLLAEGVLCVPAMDAIVCLPLSGLSADEHRDMAVHQDILAFAVVSCRLFIGAALYGPGEYQLVVAAAAMLAAIGLIITWFWSPLGG